jgi:hypothetical protein
MSNPFNDDETIHDVTGGPSSGPGFVSGRVEAEESARGTVPPRRLEERNSVITARGTSEGLVLRVDGRVEAEDLVVAVQEFLNSRRSFLSGNDVAFEWIGQRPEELVIQRITQILLNDFSVSVRASRSQLRLRSERYQTLSLPLSPHLQRVALFQALVPRRPLLNDRAPATRST